MYLYLLWTLNITCLSDKLDHVLLATEVAVVHGAWLAGDVHLDLLAGAQDGHGVEEGGDPLVRGPDVVLDPLHCEELCGAVPELVQLVGALVCLLVSLDVVYLANLQRILLPTEPAVVLDVAVWLLPELVLDDSCNFLHDSLPELVLDRHGQGVKTLVTKVTRNTCCTASRSGQGVTRVTLHLHVCLDDVEVCDLDAAQGLDEDVPGDEVPVHQPQLLEVDHAPGDLRVPVEQRLAADLVLIVPDVVQEASALSLVNEY